MVQHPLSELLQPVVQTGIEQGFLAALILIAVIAIKGLQTAARRPGHLLQGHLMKLRIGKHLHRGPFDALAHRRVLAGVGQPACTTLHSYNPNTVIMITPKVDILPPPIDSLPTPF